MADDPLEALLEKLCSGDLAAAEQVFLTYEPYLRKVVRRHIPKQLQAKFDSVDVVQSVWVDLVHGFREAGWHFANANQLRDFLLEVIRNRCIDRVRRHHRALEHEKPFSQGDLEQLTASYLPRPSDVAQANELWEQLLAICPPTHHNVLQLKRQGFRITEIATLTGLHEGSIRRILRNVALQLAMKQKPIIAHDGGA